MVHGCGSTSQQLRVSDFVMLCAKECYLEEGEWLHIPAQTELAISSMRTALRVQDLLVRFSGDTDVV